MSMVIPGPRMTLGGENFNDRMDSFGTRLARGSGARGFPPGAENVQELCTIHQRSACSTNLAV